MHPNPFGLAYSQSPVDLPEPRPPSAHSLRWTSIVIVVAALTLAFLNADAIRGWTWQLPASPHSARAAAAADWWYAAVDRLQLNRPAAAMRSRWQALKRAEPQPPGDPDSSRSALAYSSRAKG